MAGRTTRQRTERICCSQASSFRNAYIDILIASRGGSIDVAE